jgi:hypothetical protein
MSIESFVLFLCVGSALLALWLVVRFPEAGPDDLTWAMLHVGISIVLAQLTLPAIHLVADVPGARFVASFAIVLPALTYMFLAAAWLIRILAGRLQGPRF